MEKVAKRENRTLSELIRENFRRSQEMQKIDVYQLIRQMAPPPPELSATWDNAKSSGADKLTAAQIDREARTVRRQQDKKKSVRRPKR